ncbi:MAG: hypothetical protein QNJ72_07940, partial [Pleurocapsa sp. MO_226.B13]|nr:hypothetical protein [Pleurocapsa sp. MO_226.B13]
MVIQGQDNRIAITENNLNLKPFDSVVAIDTIYISGGEQQHGLGSGIVIGPNHVLTNYHVIYPGYRNNPIAARVTLAENVPSLLPRSTTEISDDDYNVDIGSEADQSPIFAISASKPRAISNGILGEDVGMFKLSNPISNNSQHIGLITYTNPQDLIGLDISTAGYPATVLARDLLRSNNTPFISEDENGEPLKTNPNVDTLPQNFWADWLNLPPENFAEEKYVTDATQLFAATGIIKSASDDEIELSSSIDLDSGQSGSGIWTILEGDSEPRVLALAAGSITGFDTNTNMATETNYGALINEEIYRGINKIMERSSSSDDGN